jgi:nitrogen regulatory protein PII
MAAKQKRITCIVPEANAVKGAAALREKYDLQTINQHFARGVGKSSPLVKRGIGEKTEKVVLSVIVETKIADEVFEFLFSEADIDRPQGGMIFMNAVRVAEF